MDSPTSRIHEWILLFRDLGLMLGVPTIVTIIGFIWRSHLAAEKAHRDLLKEFQYDNALKNLKAQRELFQMERAELESTIEGLKRAGVGGQEFREKEQSLLEVKARMK